MDSDPVSQDDLLINFQEICAATDESARTYLTRFEWNLEMAIQEYLNEKEGRPSAVRGTVHEQDSSASGSEEEEGPTGAAVRRRLGIGVDPPARGPPHTDRRRPDTWFQWCCNLVMLPFRFTFSSLWDLFNFIYSSFFAPFRRQITDPLEDVRLFREHFIAKYGDSQLRFHPGSYSQAMDEAKKDLKFMLVYLHSDRHQDTDRFCCNVLCSPDVVQFLNTNVTLWGCSVSSGEGFRVSTAMRESTYPFLALICLRDSRMSVVLRREGECSGSDLIQFLGAAIQENRVYLTMAEQERETSRINSELRKQQEDEYQDSLQQDREKERLRLQELEEVEMARDEEERLALEKEKLRNDIQQRREKMQNELPKEPSADAPDCVRVSLRFPSGSRLERRFLSDDSLEILNKVTFCHPECPDNFSIVTNYPRRTLQCCPSRPEDQIETFRLAGLERAVMLLVVDNEA